MAKDNMQERTNDYLKLSDTEIKRVDFRKSSKNICVFDADIKNIIVSDALAYSKNKETDAKYSTG